MIHKKLNNALKSAQTGLLVFILFFYSGLSAYGVQVRSSESHRQTEIFSTFSNKAAEEVKNSTSQDGVHHKAVEGDINIIVEYNRSPVLKKLDKLKREGRKGKALQQRNDRLESRIREIHRRLNDDLKTISDTANVKNKASTASARVRQTFAKVYAGAALEVSRGVIGNIRALPYVEEVYRDRKVEMVSDTVRNIIGVDRLLKDVSATGKNVDVAILDSGIDYMHPALGGGIGEKYKVKGGYDEVNSDTDPMDDNGHGTIVAGIIAADGQHTGIAPDANLYAYKVLEKDGTGLSSNVIAGLERAVNKQVDVVNMSLGGPGNSTDPLAKATNNVVRSGVLVVVAAGNKGNEYWTILSPASAKMALTVGATFKNDQITHFSSRGPTPNQFNIKPDIVAPGADIASTTLDNDFGRFTGTSVAAPVVTGAAALLLELKPDIRPLIAKSKLMQSANDLGENVWTQGYGRIQIDKAPERTTVSIPAHISFGLIPNQADQWSKKDTLTFYNLADSARDYDLKVTGDKSAGVDVEIGATRLTIPAAGSARVVMTAKVDNEMAPFPSEQPLDFSGRVMVTSTRDTLAVPWGMIKVPHVTVKTTYKGVIRLHAHPSNKTGRNKGNRLLSFGKEELIHWRFFENVPYNFIAEFKRRRENEYKIVIQDNVDIAKTDTLSILPEEAVNTIHLKPVDKNGQSFSVFERITSLKYLTHSTGFSFSHNVGANKFEVSNFSESYTLAGYNHYRKRTQRTVYHDYNTTLFKLNGVQSDQVITDDPADYRKVTYSLGDYPEPQFKNTIISGSTVTNSGSQLKFPALHAVFAGNPKQYNLHLLPHKLKPRYKIFDQSTNQLLFESARHDILARDTIVFHRSGYRYAWNVNNLNTIKVGHQLPFFSAGINNEILWTGKDPGFFHDSFGGLLAKPATASDDMIIKLHRDGKVIQEEHIPRSPFKQESIKLQSPSKGDWLELTFEEKKYVVDDTLGKLEGRYYFGGSNSGTAPKISDLRITGDGTPMNKLSFRNENEIKLRLNTNYGAVKDRMEPYNEVDSIKVYYRRSGSHQKWRMADKNADKAFIRTQISDLSTSYYDLKLSIFDTQGNQLVYEASPAFKFISSKRHLNVKSTIQAQNSRFRVPIKSLDSLGYDDITNYQFSFTYEDSLLSFKKVYLEGTLSEGSNYRVRKDSSGKITVWVVSPEPIRGVGDLVKLQFKTKQMKGISPIKIVNFNFTPEDLNAISSAGTVRILPELLGDLSNNRQITAYDASRILHFTHEKIEFTSAEKVVANVGGSRWITAQDALLVLHKVVGQIKRFPVRNLNNLTDSDYRLRKGTKKKDSPVFIGKPIRRDSNNKQQLMLDVPLYLETLDDVRSVRTTLTFQTDKIRVEEVNFMVNDKWLSHHYYHDKDQTLKLATAGTNRLSNSKFAVVRIAIDGELRKGAEVTTKGSSRINEEEVGRISQTTLLDIPDQVKLKQNYPNPFNPETTIRYGIPNNTHVQLNVYNVQGKRVAQLVNQNQKAGMHEITFNGSNLASGVYFYTLRTNNKLLSKKLLLLK